MAFSILRGGGGGGGGGGERGESKIERERRRRGRGKKTTGVSFHPSAIHHQVVAVCPLSVDLLFPTVCFFPTGCFLPGVLLSVCVCVCQCVREVLVAVSCKVLPTTGKRRKVRRKTMIINVDFLHTFGGST